MMVVVSTGRSGASRKGCSVSPSGRRAFASSSGESGIAERVQRKMLELFGGEVG